MKTLVIAEKPSVASDISRALGGCKKAGDHYESDDFVVSSAVGHLVELAMPEDYDKKARFWTLQALPIIPSSFQLKPIENNKKKFEYLRKLMARKDVGEIINACDAGREGELIFNNLYELAKCTKPVRRLWLSSMTRDGIREAFEHLRTQESMVPLGQAARCRSEADWLIGINCTRGATKRLFGSKGGNVAGVGRVQTPTLAMVMEREVAIRSFQPREFFRIVAQLKVHQGLFEGVYQKPGFKKSEDEHDRVDRIWDRSLAETILEESRNETLAQVSEEQKKATQAAPRLYDLTSLQREANGRFGFPARKTLSVAQSLYEKHKMITYPRTDSRALPEDYPATCRQVMEAMPDPYAPHANKVLEQNWIRPNKRIFNNAAVSDHFAIIPTTVAGRKLSDDEAKIYDMIVRRFLAVFYPAAEFAVTTRLSHLGAHVFKSEGKVMLEPGWLAVYGRTTVDEKAPVLPPLSGEDKPGARSPHQAAAKVEEVEMQAEETKPPPRFSEATLLSAMEGAGKLVDDEELADAMKEKGLGTPATRAQIIERLIQEKYIERERRELIPTGKAETLLDFLRAIKAEELTSPSLTGEWEYKLRKIEHRELEHTRFREEIARMTESIVQRIKSFEEQEEDAVPTDLISPIDQTPLLETTRAYRSRPGDLVIYKVVGNRRLELEEIRTLLQEGQVGPLDGFLSKNGKRFSAILKLDPDHKVKFVFADGDNSSSGKIDLSELTPFARCPKTGGDLFETPNQYVVRVREKGNDSTPIRISRKILGRDIPREQVLKLLETGKTDLLEKFWSQRTRKPFSAFLVLKENGSTGFAFPPREAKSPAQSSRKGKATKEK